MRRAFGFVTKGSVEDGAKYNEVTEEEARRRPDVAEIGIEYSEEIEEFEEIEENNNDESEESEHEISGIEQFYSEDLALMHCFKKCRNLAAIFILLAFVCLYLYLQSIDDYLY